MSIHTFSDHEGSRRQFLGSSAANAAGVAAGMVGITGAVAKASPNDRVTLGVIGVRSRGRVLAREFAGLPNADVVSLCDVDENVLPRGADDVRTAQGRAPRLANDFRHLLDDRTIDAVVIAAPDHWHALMTIMACQSGKDVYVEKPVSHTICEGERMIAAAERSDRVVQTGLQQRSLSHFQSAVDVVRSGRLGTVRLARAWTVHRRKPESGSGHSRPPRGVDYDLWLGPAQRRPFDSHRFHHNWRWYWDYGTGELGNWGTHMLDVARWGLNVDLPNRVATTGGVYHLPEQETPDTLLVNYTFDDTTIVWEHRQWSNRGIEGRSTAAAFYGDRGTLIVDRGGWKIYDGPDTESCEPDRLESRHLASFIESIASRRQPSADLRTGHTSSTLAHLGNIAFRVGHEVAFDRESLNFGDDSGANALLTRDYRRQWELPEA